VRLVGQLPRIIAWCTVNKTLNYLILFIYLFTVLRYCLLRKPCFVPFSQRYNVRVFPIEVASTSTCRNIIWFDIPFSNELRHICLEFIVFGFSMYPDYVVWSFAASLYLHDRQETVVINAALSTLRSFLVRCWLC